MSNFKISLIIPAKNEGSSLQVLLPQLRQVYPDFEIIVVNDGSTDNTVKIVDAAEVFIVSHPYSIGNGAAIKSGARKASGDILIFMDGDGQHQVEHVALLLQRFHQGYDMVVGARESTSQASIIRWLGNSFGNWLATLVVGHKVQDLTSGLRIVNAQKFKEFLHLLPNGFSSPTTITLAFFRSGYSVSYVPVKVQAREGKSHLKPIKESVKFLLIIYKITTLYSPLKVFLPFALLHFMAGIMNYAYTYFTQNRFTNMSAVFLSASVIIFLIGLLSEQITMLTYAQANWNINYRLSKQRSVNLLKNKE